VMPCDLLAVSSDTEQMPLVVLEAMDAALPVASFDVGDVRSMLSPENRPFVVGHSTLALTAAIARLVEDPQLRRTVGAANRARATEVFGADSMIRAHRRLLEQLAAGGR
jgi:glycosyltransferase involved in cell wall biosynthesis